jgi:hypothetical protein
MQNRSLFSIFEGKFVKGTQLCARRNKNRSSKYRLTSRRLPASQSQILGHIPAQRTRTHEPFHPAPRLTHGPQWCGSEWEGKIHDQTHHV